MIRVLLSGGMDSAACLAWAKTKQLPVIPSYDSKLDFVDAVGFFYGQRNAARELEAARSIARHCGVRFRVQPLQVEKGSSLTGQGPLSGKNLIVPSRNQRMLEAAARMQPFPDALVIGACADDAKLFVDCRRDVLDKIQKNLGVPVYSPLVNLTKGQVVQFAKDHHAFNCVVMSWSCYAGGESPCLECNACLARKRALQ
jgi:7-cyano-7-deazaguanine synthase